MNIPKNIAIHTGTEDLFDKVIKRLEELGLKNKFTGNIWLDTLSKTCLSNAENEGFGKIIAYSKFDWYKKKNYIIIEAEEFLKQYNKKEMKEIKVEVPEGMEVDLEKSIINEHEVSIVYKAIKKYIDYSDVSPRQSGYNLEVSSPNAAMTDNSCSAKQLEKIFAINQLQNIANYYNGDKEVNFNDESLKHSIYYLTTSKKEYLIQSHTSYNNGGVHFLNEQAAQSVIDNPNFKDILDKIYK